MPLAYYDIIADQVGKKDDGLSEYTSAANHFFNNDVQNPNTMNKHNAYPLTMVTKLTQKEQDFISEFLTNTVEKLHWEPAEIAMQLKVIEGFSLATIAYIYLKVAGIPPKNERVK